MEFPLIFRTRNPSLLPLFSTSFTTTTPSTSNLSGFHARNHTRRRRKSSSCDRLQVCIRATSERSSEGVDGGRDGGDHGRFAGPAMEVTTFCQSFGKFEFPVWDKLGAVVRLSYGIGIYGAMAVAGSFICSFTGIDSMGGFHPSIEAILEALGYTVLPIMTLLFILDDKVVKLSPHARAIRDVEEELRSFFYGMSPWQFILIVTASSVGEELFYRAAVQQCEFFMSLQTHLKASSRHTFP